MTFGLTFRSQEYSFDPGQKWQDLSVKDGLFTNKIHLGVKTGEGWYLSMKNSTIRGCLPNQSFQVVCGLGITLKSLHENPLDMTRDCPASDRLSLALDLFEDLTTLSTQM